MAKTGRSFERSMHSKANPNDTLERLKAGDESAQESFIELYNEHVFLLAVGLVSTLYPEKKEKIFDISGRIMKKVFFEFFKEARYLDNPMGPKDMLADLTVVFFKAHEIGFDKLNEPNAL